jgi:hypothetical protein
MTLQRPLGMRSVNGRYRRIRSMRSISERIIILLQRDIGNGRRRRIVYLKVISP